MAKINLENVAGGYNLSAINNNFDILEQTVNENLLSRAGVGSNPNEMKVDLDMNGKRIYNLPLPVEDHEAVRLIDLKNASVGGQYQKTLRVNDVNIPALPDAATRANKLLSFNSQGVPQVQFPASDSATQLRIDLANEGGAGLIGFSYAETYPRNSIGYLVSDWVNITAPPFNAPGLYTASRAADTAAFQAALDYATPLGKGVVIPPGMWDISEVNLPTNAVVKMEQGALIAPTVHSPAGAIFTNVNVVPQARQNIHIINPQFDGQFLPFTGTTRANDNAIGFALGVDGVYIYGGDIRNFRANHANGPGGKGIGFEQGVKNVYVYGTRISNCTYATFTSSHLNDPAKYISNINFFNLVIENCGNAVFAFGFSNVSGTVPTEDPNVCSASWFNCYVRNTGHHPDRPVGGRREKTGVVVVSGASFITIKGMVVHNNVGYPNATYPAGGTLYPTGYPTFESNAIGGGLSGPIGAVVWEYGKFNNIEVTYSGDCDDLWKCSMARATGAVSFAGEIRPTASFGSRIKISHVGGTTKALASSGMIGGTATVVSSTALTLTASSGNLNERDNYYVGTTISFTSGTASGYSGLVTAYNASTKTFTLNTSFTAFPTAGDTFGLGSTASVEATEISGIYEVEYDKVTENVLNSTFRFPNLIRGKFTGNAGQEIWGTFDRVYSTNNNPAGPGTEEGGRWTPTVTSPINITGAVTIVNANYTRNGPIVVVSGIFTARATVNGSLGFQLSLPIPTDVTSSSQGQGVLSSGTNVSGQIFMDTTADTLRFSWQTSDITNVVQYAFTATYRMVA